jgi:uncharacterized protein (DUF1015 family)
MPHIQAFRGLRYDLGHVGSLSDVVAPPYDIIDDELQDELYTKHPANVVRLILNRDEPGDDAQSNRYARAARFLRQWRNEGVLKVDPAPAIYVYHQVFKHDGVERTRRGFMCRVSLEKFGEGTIFPHEETHASAKEDRLKLTRACGANLSPVFGLFPDDENRTQNLLEAAVRDKTPLEAVDHLGVVHRMWMVADLKTISEVQSVMDNLPTYIADGHHRYETACNYRNELSAVQSLPDNHPANYVLMACIGMSDPGLVVLPTHRLFHGIASMDSNELIRRLEDCFDCRVAGEGSDLAEMIWLEIEAEGDQGTIGLFTASDQRWTIARINDAGRARMGRVATEHSLDWQSLGVAILHRLIVETLLGEKSLPKPKYVHLIREIIEGLESGDEDGSTFPLAALVMPATLEHIRSISEHGERMPAKSTYFYPKLLSGLVINLHE